jgi:peptidoglycan/LPS O-acetylase OafA/YrhL
LGLSEKRVPELDGLRGVAILLVVIFHYRYGVPGFAPGTIGAYFVAPFVRMGWSGVDLFFVLSGFLICGLLLRLSDITLRGFYLRRAARTMPLYVVMLALFVLGVGFQRSGWLDLPNLFGSVHSLWPYFLLVQNNAYAINAVDLNFITPSWSLAIEEQFYLLFPLLFIVQPRRRVVLGILSAMVAISVLLRSTPIFGTEDGVASLTAWQYFFTLCHLDGLAVGAIISITLADARWRALLQSNALLLIAIFVLLGSGVLAEAKWTGLLGPFLTLWLSLFYGIALILAALAHPVVGFLRFRVLRFFGDISYGLYLFHVPTLALLTAFFVLPQADPLSQRPVLCTLIAITVSVTLAVVSRRFLELPVIYAAKRWRPSVIGSAQVA